MKFTLPARITPVARVLLAIAVVITLYQATIPQPVDLLPSNYFDKVLHASAFFVLSFLAELSFPGRRTLGWRLLALTSFGIFVEMVQVYIPWRSSEFMDVVADCTGMTLWLLLAMVVRRMVTNREGLTS